MVIIMDEFPNELYYTIFEFFTPKELLLCSQLDDNFNSLCDLKSLWKKYNKGYKNVFYGVNRKIRKNKHRESYMTKYKLKNLSGKLETKTLNNGNVVTYMSYMSLDFMMKCPKMKLQYIH